MDPIYILKTTKAHAKEDVRRLFNDILGHDAIDRLLAIDGLVCDLRIYVFIFWCVPMVNEFHQLYTDPGDTLYGKKLPGVLEQLNPYGIFRDGHFPAPHFLRNSHNLSDSELDQLGIGGPGEFVYVQLPTDDDKDSHWEMYRDGTYYMPDMTYYNKHHLDPLSATDKPLKPCMPRIKIPTDPNISDFKRWRDFYIEYPATWPKDLTDEERATLEETYASVDMKSRWSPECGRDPTNLAEQQERLENTDLPIESVVTLGHLVNEAVMSPIERQFSMQPEITRSIPQREGDPYPPHERMFFTNSQYMNGLYKWNYRKFD